jgi:hypothetical protein
MQFADDTNQALSAPVGGMLEGVYNGSLNEPIYFIPGEKDNTLNMLVPNPQTNQKQYFRYKVQLLNPKQITLVPFSNESGKK